MDEADTGQAGEDDAGSGPVFDESFVRGAALREPSADERARRARIDAEHQRLVQEKRLEHEHRRRALKREVRTERRTNRFRKVALMVLLVLLIGVAYLSTRTTKARREAVSYKGDQATAALNPASGINLQGGEPPAGVGEKPDPLGRPAPPPPTTGPYKFLETQAGTGTPVAYDPCRPIHVVINDRLEPPGGDALVRAALARASQISGFQFVIDGTTTETPSMSRQVYEPDRYPGVWAPVLVAWTDPSVVPVLAGDVAGLGGSASVPIVGQQVYVSGMVYLDGPQMTQIIGRANGPAQAQAVIEHEVGHLLGLAHVNDPSQIMNPVSGPVTDYAAGDQLGLEALGRGRCFPDI